MYLNVYKMHCQHFVLRDYKKISGFSASLKSEDLKELVPHLHTELSPLDGARVLPLTTVPTILRGFPLTPRLRIYVPGVE